MKSWSENNREQGQTYCVVFRSGVAIETNRGRENNIEKKQYQSLLNVNGEQSYQIRSRNLKMIESDLVDYL